jgi:Fe-S cluster assembly protein SufD
MVDFMQQALERAPQQAPQWLEPLQQQGRSHWQNKRFPTRKTESWKYTSLRPLEQGGYLAEPPVSAVNENALREHFAIADLNACVLVFVNGHFNAALSDADVPEGMELVRFSEANAEQADQIILHLGTVAKSNDHMFAALNDSWLDEGVFVRIAKNTRVEKPLQIVWLTTAQNEAFSVSQRLLVVAEPGSEATVLEHFASDDAAQSSFTNGVTELVLEPNAKLHHYRLHLEEEHALHIGGVHAALGRDAVLNSFHLAMGGKVKRLDVVVNHDGEGAHCELNGVYLPRHEQHVDYHTCIEHAVPRCTTSETFRGIVGDSGRAVFNGRIHIHPDAQKTLAQLSNKNLLTSTKAEVDTKPELEIYADDVQCAHGATVAQLDESAVHYLRSRGVSQKEAEVMLSFGFINELVNKVRHDAVSDYLRPMLARLFARDPALVRHISP